MRAQKGKGLSFAYHETAINFSTQTWKKPQKMTDKKQSNCQETERSNQAKCNKLQPDKRKDWQIDSPQAFFSLRG